MVSFFTGDELGSLKLISGTKSTNAEASSSQWRLDEHVLHSSLSKDELEGDEPEKLKAHAIDRLAARSIGGAPILAAARRTGIVNAFSVDPVQRNAELIKEWKEARFKQGHSFVGLEVTPESIFWCTSSGALGLVRSSNEEESSAQKATLPMRLCDWKLSTNSETFAYGGNEVDLSVWSTERAFSTQVQTCTKEQSTKRKRGDELLPGEIWRAKNLPNDSLNLRQPIHITSLTYLPVNPANNSIHLVTGTALGDVRRYDTRAARRPVANWKGIGKTGGIGVVQAGSNEHEVFVSDKGSILSALDLRNGKVIYSYKGLQGAITSIASPQNNFIASTSRDRFFRLHTAPPPPLTAGQQTEERGEVLGRLYTKSVSTSVVYAPVDATNDSDGIEEGGDEEDEDVWAGMKEADESDGEVEKGTKTKRAKK